MWKELSVSWGQIFERRKEGKEWHSCGPVLQRKTQHVNLNQWIGNLSQWIFIKKYHSFGSSALYSLDLNHCDFFLFTQLKNYLKKSHLGTLINIQKIVTEELKVTPEEAFQKYYEDWKQRLRWYVTVEGKLVWSWCVKGIKFIVAKKQSHYFSNVPCI